MDLSDSNEQYSGAGINEECFNMFDCAGSLICCDDNLCKDSCGSEYFGSADSLTMLVELLDSGFGLLVAVCCCCAPCIIVGIIICIIQKNRKAKQAAQPISGSYPTAPAAVEAKPSSYPPANPAEPGIYPPVPAANPAYPPTSAYPAASPPYPSPPYNPNAPVAYPPPQNAYYPPTHESQT